MSQPISKTEQFVLYCMQGMSDAEAREAAGLPSPPGRAYKLLSACQRVRLHLDADWLESELKAARAKIADLGRLKHAQQLLKSSRRQKASQGFSKSGHDNS